MAHATMSPNSNVFSFQKHKEEITLTNWAERNLRWRSASRQLTDAKELKICPGHMHLWEDRSDHHVRWCRLCNVVEYDVKGNIIYWPAISE